jgi:hypothetical protein
MLDQFETEVPIVCEPGLALRGYAVMTYYYILRDSEMSKVSSGD